MRYHFERRATTPVYMWALPWDDVQRVTGQRERDGKEKVKDWYVIDMEIDRENRLVAKMPLLHFLPGVLQEIDMFCFSS